MLVFISDLHLTDGEAAVQFLPVNAFEGALRDIAQQAEKAKSEDVTIVFLGDIFDLVRTPGWFTPPETVRPWKLPPQLDAVEARANELLDRLADQADNRKTFALWQGSLQERFGFHVEPNRVYLPGNHDRICNQFPSLRARVMDLLGFARNPSLPALDPSKPFSHIYVNREYRTFARHGHELDPYNCEAGDALKGDRYAEVPYECYMKIPIGELIATEVASKLAPYVREELNNVASLSDEERDVIANHMKTVDDVHPISSLIPWLISGQATTAQEAREEVLKAVKRGINRVLEEFEKIRFTRDWIKEHDQISLQPDVADKLQIGLWLLHRAHLERMEVLLPLLDRAGTFFPDDNFAHEAAREFHRLDNGGPGEPGHFLYVLYGHTHTAAQIPIETNRDNQARVYLNTGTWRPHARQGIEKRGFMSWKNLTYTLIYHPQIDPDSQAAAAGYPTFETWTGSLLEVPPALRTRDPGLTAGITP